ncbi:hypothetical protein TREAZ_3429 [Leadbettera azotonutricia ZAS-9]|uniref:Uncharacterized protein n=1 Tax=Leadbettera azotonutricia (strain ATCC BAA-888 / DSM 13862 / ZAS-9) TaxID=545695 RepID=F5Y7T9_LEAAZ|nr:hypothetical protein TREAZ_3429 [Leadbettera azotonutricia ZAS-9]
MKGFPDEIYLGRYAIHISMIVQKRLLVKLGGPTAPLIR